MNCTNELKPNEIWLGNTDVRQGVKIPEYLNSLKTARIGNQAYDIKGKPLDRGYMRPLIIDKSEADAYDRIMMNLCKEARYGKTK